MNKLLFFLLISSVPWMALAQSNTCDVKVSGEVVDAVSKEPVAYATIQVVGSSVGVLTDEFGYFELDGLCDQEIDLKIAHLGYKSLVHHHDPDHHHHIVHLSPESLQLQGVVIEEVKKSAGLTSGVSKSISAKELDAYLGGNLGDALTTVSGVNAVSNGQNIVKPVVHGLHTNRVLIINNELRHEFQNWGDGHAAEIELSAVDRIEVVKGAATVRYGSEALGGVVKLSDAPLNLHSGFNGQAVMSGRSNGRAAHAAFNLQYGFDAVSLAVHAGTTKQGDLTAADYQLTNTGKQSWEAGLNARFHKGVSDFTLGLSHVQQKLGILRGSVVGNLNDLDTAMRTEPPYFTKDFSYEIGTPYQEVAHSMAKLKGLFLKGEHVFEIIYGLQRNSRKEFDVRRGTNNSLPSINLLLYAQSLSLDWEHPKLAAWKGNAGLQINFTDNNNIAGTNTTPFLPNYNTFKIGGYWIESVALTASTIDLGLRYDFQKSDVRGRDSSNEPYFNELRFENITATVGWNKVTDHFNISTNLGLAWRAPNMAELYSFGKHQAIIQYGLLRYEIDENGQISTGKILTNEDKNVGSELGYKWVGSVDHQKNKSRLSFTLYANWIKNYIYSRPYGITQTQRGALPYYIYEQTNALLTGFDIDWSVKHNANWQSKFSGDYVYARDVKNDSWFVGIPPAAVKYELLYQKKNEGKVDYWSVGLSPGYIFSQYQAPQVITVGEIIESEGQILNSATGVFDFLAAPAGYFLLQLNAKVNIKQFQLGLGVYNVTNAKYRSYTNTMRYFADEKGFDLSLDLKYNF